MYDYFCDIEHLYVKKYEGDYPIQKWTAGMWSLLWNAWYYGNEEQVSNDLAFGWSTDSVHILHNKQFLHNAGVTYDRTDLFYKGNFTNRLPYNLDLKFNKEFASNLYYEAIQKVEKKSPLTNINQ
jgi:hypothetical protein